MGKAALLMVVASTMIMIGVSKKRVELDIEMQETQTEYQEKVLAREAATSFFTVIAKQSEDDFDGYRISQSGLQYKDAYMQFSAVGTSSDEVGLTATAYVGGAAHGVQGLMVQSGGGTLDAVTVDGSIDNIKAAGSSFHISGLDTDPGQPIGSGGSPTYAIRATHQGTADALEAKIDADQMTGLTSAGETGEGSMVVGESGVDLDQLYDDIVSYVDVGGVGGQRLSGDQAWHGNEVFGSQESPVIYVVDGNVDFGGTIEGYGILLVNGDLTVAHGTPKWEGIIYATGVNADGTSGGSSEFKGTVDIYGALILRTNNIEPEEGDEVDATLDFSINGNVNLMYSSKVISRFPTFIPSLNAQPTMVSLGGLREVASSRTLNENGEYTYESYQDHVQENVANLEGSGTGGQ